MTLEFLKQLVSAGNQNGKRRATMKHCDRCGEPFIPREAKQRFCCRTCSNAWFAEERREAVRLLRARRDGEHDARAD